MCVCTYVCGGGGVVSACEEVSKEEKGFQKKSYVYDKCYSYE